MSLNLVVLEGRLGNDVETRAVGQTTVSTFSMALSKKWTDKQSGEKREKTTWVNCQAWGRTGETIAQHFRKGSGICVQGELVVDQYQDQTTGANRTSTKVDVSTFHFPVSNPNDGQGQQNTNYQRNNAPQGGNYQGQPQGGYNQNQPMNNAPQGGYQGQPQGGYQQAPQAPQNGYQGQPQPPQGGYQQAPQGGQGGNYQGQPQNGYQGQPQNGYQGQPQGGFNNGGNDQFQQPKPSPVDDDIPFDGVRGAIALLM